MIRRLLFVPLFAALPALLCAQDAKVVSCRTLEAAGNFVGPDEVIVNGMVCPKTKPAADANAAVPPGKSMQDPMIPGDATGLVDAANAANKRVEAAIRAAQSNADRAPASMPKAQGPSTFRDSKEEVTDPVVQDSVASFSDSMDRIMAGRSAGDAKPATESSCDKNITLAGVKGDKLILGTPAWAAKWIEQNHVRMRDVCFSDKPVANARNYLIVFYTSPMNPESKAVDNSAISADGKLIGGVQGFTLKYGSTWHYAQGQAVGETVLAQRDADEPQSDVTNVWHATAYTETGAVAAEHSPEKISRQLKLDVKDAETKKGQKARAEVERVSNELLAEMVGEIEKL
jgi:hypothetical protein